MNVARKQLESGVVVLELIGVMVMGPDCERLDQEVDQTLEQNQNRVVLDMTAVKHIDSAGLGKIVSCFSKLKKAGGGLRVAGAHGMVETALKTTHLDRIISLYSTAAEAGEGFASA